MLSTNAQAWATSPKTALSYLGKEKILRTDNGAIIIERDDGKASAIRKERGATEEVKLDHTISLQLGGDNSEGNLKLVPTDVHKGYNAMENEVARRLRTGVINGVQAKKDILALKNGDTTLEEYIGTSPDGVERPGLSPSKETASKDVKASRPDQKSVYSKYGLKDIPSNDTINDLNTKFAEKVADGRITDVNRDAEQRQLAKDSYKSQFDDTTDKFYKLGDNDMRRSIQAGNMTKAQIDKVIEVDNALTEAGLQKYMQVGKTLRGELGYGLPKASSKSGGGRKSSGGRGGSRGGRRGSKGGKGKAAKKYSFFFEGGSNPISTNKSLRQLLNDAVVT